ncbi:MAG: tetratricopeptide repeat protein [Candidatus Omnitrophica bacterium]|nr:tetratricopeptide repeat protein [Candidatus Omnitrophota bacterium]
MIKTSVTQKIAFLIFGMVLFMVGTELLLRAGGWVYYGWWQKGAQSLQEDNRITAEDQLLSDRSGDIGAARRVLCVGDSFTFGFGAPFGNSYPAQLQALCKVNAKDLYVIYNCGIPGCSSAELLRRFSGYLKKYNPDIVFLLVGSNDISNPGFSEIVSAGQGRQTCFSSFSNLIFRLRIYKVFRFVQESIQKLILTTYLTRNNIVKEEMDEQNSEIQIAYSFFLQGELERARQLFRKVISDNPTYAHTYLFLGQLYAATEEFSKALDCFEKFISLRPYSSRRKELFEHLYRIYLDDPDLRNEAKRLMKKIPSDKVFRNPGIPFIISREEVERNLERNLQELVILTRREGARLVLQTYPRNPRYGNVNRIIRESAEKHSIPLVDNEIEFRRLPEIGKYFITDGHPNSEGYSIMAQKAFEMLMSVVR